MCLFYCMKLKFLGTSAAFDFSRATTSILVESDTKLMLDCGWPALQNLWKYTNYDVEYLDAVFVSHKHADHTSGIPVLLMFFVSRGRKKPLKIIGFPGVQQVIEALWKNSFDIKIPYEIDYIEADNSFQLNELKLEFAKGIHSSNVEVYAVKVSGSKNSFVYAPDTKYSKDIVVLSKNVDLIIHECAVAEKEHPEHSNVAECVRVLNESKAKKMALLHISSREFDKVKQQALLYPNMFIPDDMDDFIFNALELH